jgi:hypothetical protein
MLEFVEDAMKRLSGGRNIASTNLGHSLGNAICVVRRISWQRITPFVPIVLGVIGRLMIWKNGVKVVVVL